MLHYRPCFKNILNTLSKSLLIFCLQSFALNVFALPIDWKGGLGVNWTMFDTFRRTNNQFAANGDGSQFIERATGNHKNASFQNYTFRLEPSIIINDSVSFHGEISTGHDRGGFLGDGSSYKKGNSTTKSFGDALYLQNSFSGEPNISLNKFYLELFTDAATFLLGRQPFHWGLGAIWNSGNHIWDRHSTTYDGILAKFKIGNFSISPFYAKNNSLGSLTKASQTSSQGISLLYDNVQKDLSFGILFSMKKSGSENSFYTSGTTGNPLGSTNVKTTDFFLKKTFGSFNVGIEVPFVAGDLGNVYKSNENSKYKANAIISEFNYNLNENWNFGLNLGHATGDDGQGSNYTAMYLNPNYQVALLMFRYNLYAINDRTLSVYDSYIVNAKYAKLSTTYKIDSWSWEGSAIYALANETANINSYAFNHSKNKTFYSIRKQEKDLGVELDLSSKYQWNANTVLNADIGYHFVGDYFEYTNNDPIKSHNTYAIMAGIAVQF